MKTKNKYLKEIVPHLKEKYGAERAEAVIASAWERYGAICAENADEPKAYDMHTKDRIYPAIACLQAMTAMRTTSATETYTPRFSGEGLRPLPAAATAATSR